MNLHSPDTASNLISLPFRYLSSHRWNLSHSPPSTYERLKGGPFCHTSLSVCPSTTVLKTSAIGSLLRHSAIAFLTTLSVTAGNYKACLSGKFPPSSTLPTDPHVFIRILRLLHPHHPYSSHFGHWLARALPAPSIPSCSRGSFWFGKANFFGLNAVHP